MPTVPAYQQQTELRPLPAPQQSSVATPALLGGMADSGAKLAQGVMSASGDVLAASARLQDAEDVKAVLDAEVALKTDYVRYDADLKTNRRGGFSKGAGEDTKKWFDEQTKKHQEALATPRQRQLFTSRAASLRTTGFANASEFERTETRTAQNETFAASRKTEIDLATSDLTGGLVPEATRRIRNLNAAQGALNGWSGDVLAYENAKEISQLHDQMIQALAAKNPDLAKGYFDKYEPEITDSKTKTRLSKLAESANIAVGSVKAGGEIFDPSKGLDEMMAVARSRFEKEPEMLKAVGDQLRARLTEYNLGEKSRVNSVAAKINLAALNGASSARIRGMPEFLQLSSMGETGVVMAQSILQHAQRTEEHQASLAASRASQAAAAESRAYTAERRQQDRLNNAGLETRMRLMDPERLSRMTHDEVVNLRTVIGDANTLALVEQHKALEKGGQAALREAKIDNDQFNSFLGRVGIPLKPKDEPTKQLIVNARNQIEQRIASQQAATPGKVLTRADKDAIIENVIKDTVKIKNNFWFDSEVPAVLIPQTKGDTTAERAYVVVDGREVKMASIPAADRARIVAARQRHGLPVTQQDIAAAWLNRNNVGTIK